MGAGFFAAIAFAVFLAALRAAGPVPAAFFFSAGLTRAVFCPAAAFPGCTTLAADLAPRPGLPLDATDGSDFATRLTGRDFAPLFGLFEAMPLLAAIRSPSSYRSANRLQRTHPRSL